MPAELFQSDLPSTPIRRRVSVLPISITAHVVAIAGFVIAPLFATVELPEPPRSTVFHAVTPVAPPPPPPPVPSRKSAPTANSNPSAAPIDAPEKIFPEPLVTHDAQHVGPADGEDYGVPGGFPGGTAIGPVAALPPPPVVPQGPVRPGGQIKPPRRLVNVAPAYPSIAQSARIEGEVQIEAVIGEDGRVRDARVLSGKPILTGAALDAVRQWVFTPTTLNGQPVAVIMTVTVVFTLR